MPGHFHRRVRRDPPVAVLERRDPVGQPWLRVAVLVVDGKPRVEHQVVLEADGPAPSNEQHSATWLRRGVHGESDRLGAGAAGWVGTRGYAAIRGLACRGWTTARRGAARREEQAAREQ